jgi:hypothetical protein
LSNAAPHPDCPFLPTAEASAPALHYRPEQQTRGASTSSLPLTHSKRAALILIDDMSSTLTTAA